MPWTAVVNPAAGRGRNRRLAPRLRGLLAENDVEVVVSTQPGDPPRLAREAAGRGRGIVACGGDGLVAAVAGVCAEADTPLAVVPTGSGNDFARAIGLDPRHPDRAVRWIRDGVPRRVDLGRTSRLDGSAPTWFTTVANTGFDAEANRWANTVHRVSGTTLYLAAIARTLATYRPTRFRVSVDGAPMIEYPAWLVACANSSTYAGGMRIAPSARIDDGHLDLTVIGDVNRPTLVANLPRVASGSIAKHPRVTTLTGRSFVVEALDGVEDSGSNELWASGEFVGSLPRAIEAVPAVLTVQVPPTTSSSGP